MIYCFSGTGNSLAVARELARHTGDLICGITDRSTPADSVKCPPAPADSGTNAGEDSRIIWVFPIYSWGLPRPVIEAINRLPVSRWLCSHYMVATCGDDAGLADRQWAHLLIRRGQKVDGAATVIMPNTYTMMKGFDVDAPDVAAAKLAAMPARVAALAALIKSGEPFFDMVRGRFAWLKSKLIYPWFMRFATGTGPFHATGGCISCGLCERQCPAGCIKLTADGLPQWTAAHCYMCERCYHQCPRHAIAYGKATIGKGTWQTSL